MTAEAESFYLTITDKARALIKVFYLNIFGAGYKEWNTLCHE